MVLLTSAEARSRLHVGRNALYELIERREIAVVKRGRKFLIPESEIERLNMRDLIPAKRSFFPHRSRLQAPRPHDREAHAE